MEAEADAFSAKAKETLEELRRNNNNNNANGIGKTKNTSVDTNNK